MRLLVSGPWPRSERTPHWDVKDHCNVSNRSRPREDLRALCRRENGDWLRSAAEVPVPIFNRITWPTRWTIGIEGLRDQGIEVHVFAGRGVWRGVVDSAQ